MASIYHFIFRKKQATKANNAMYWIGETQNGATQIWLSIIVSPANYLYVGVEKNRDLVFL